MTSRRVACVRRAHSAVATLVLAATVFGWPAVGQAATAIPETTQAAVLDVPGGTGPLAHVLGLDPGASRPRVMLAAIRLLWAPVGGDPIADRRRADTRVYLDAIAAVSRAWQAVGRQPASMRSLHAALGDARMTTLAASLGCDAEARGGRWRFTPMTAPGARRLAALMGEAGLDVSATVAALNEGQAASLALGSDTVPLPLPPPFWKALLKPPETATGSLLTEILADRRATLSYYGALALDEPARALVARLPRSVLDHDLRASMFATIGRSLHVDAGRILVPGGPAAIPVWEAVVDARVTEPAAFVANLLERHEGRVALLYDALAHVGPAVQTWALGTSLPEAERIDRFKALLSAASAGLAGWFPRVRAFERLVFDAPHLLLRVRLRPDGRALEGPSSREFWTQVFQSDDVSLAPAGSAAWTHGEELDAPTLVGLLCVENTTLRRDRTEAFLFAQRVFPSPPAPALGDVLVALRGFFRFRALALTLERMGIVDPAAYAAVMHAADRVSRASGAHAWTSLAQFQSVVAVVERARFFRAIDVPTATAWLRGLAAVPLSANREYVGGMAEWIDARLMAPGLATLTVPEFCDHDRPVESRLMAVMAGAVPDAPGDADAAPRVEWEGLGYRVDPSRATLRRMVDVRAKQGGLPLDAALSLARDARAVSLATSVRQLGPPLDRLARTVDAVVALIAATSDETDVRGRPDLVRDLAESRRALGDLRGTPSPAGYLAAMAPLLRSADWYLARALAAIVYAPNLGEPDSPALLGGDPSPAHDFGLSEARLERRLPIMWSLPTEQRDAGGRWYVTGSLLGLDVALGRFALRRVPSEVMPSPPALTDIERQAFTEPVVLISPFAHTEEARAALLGALAAGRARLAAATTPDALAAAARDAALDEWRTQLLPWLAAHEPERLADWWSLGEILALGLGREPRPEAFDAWGTSGLSMDGALTCTFPWDPPWATLSGRKGTRLVAALVPDLGLALAEALASIHLPARLSAGVLAVATQDFLDTVRASHDDDWLSLVVYARQVVTGRIEDYVSALTIGGPLVPDDMEQPHVGGK